MTTETQRWVKCYAWFPTRLTNRKWIWRRWYICLETWEQDESGWSVGAWVPRERYIENPRA